MCDASLIGTGTSQQPRKRKRSRSVSRQHIKEHTAEDVSDYKQENEDARSFDIGDIDELMYFFKCRLEALTMKPLRPIVTAWIKLLEPERLSLYGVYHKKLPKDQPQGCTTPPWWPQDVPYQEPSHLQKAGESHLTVTTLVT